MKILFDARHIKEIYSGLARYTHSIIKSLMDINSFDKLEIILDKNENYKENPLFKDTYLKKGEKCNFIYLDAPLFKLKHHINISLYVNKSDCDIYFYPHFDLPFFVKRKSIFVVHDLLPLVVDNYILKYKTIKKQYFKSTIGLNLLKKNTRCIAVSKSTKNDILKLISNKYENKIDIVYEDSFEDVIKVDKSNEKVNEVITLKYLLYIGDRRPHKNLKEMIDIFERLKKVYDYDGFFIIAGSERNFDINIDEYIKNNQYIKTIGRVSDSELMKLYKEMDGLFFLSKYEGFGLPIVEASKFNKKIILSDKSSCGEIAPPNALKINLKDNIELKTDRIYEYLDKDLDIENSKYLEKYSWEKSVKEIFRV